MGIALLGFLGRGPYAPGGKRNPYRKVTYQFDNGQSDEVSFFLKAAFHSLQQKKERPNRLVVVGTAGSMWDELLLGFSAPSEQQRLTPLLLRLIEAVDHQAVGADDLREVESELSRALDVEAHAELIPPAQNAEEQAQVLAALQRHVHPGDRVYLDVTNGYRHLPMLSLGAAVLLSRLRDAEIADILYGAVEMRQGDGPAPVVSLRWLLDLLDWAESIKQLLTGGKLRALTHVVSDGELQKCLANTSFLLSTNQVHQAGEAASECLKAVEAAKPEAILDLTREAIKENLETVAGCKRDASGILRMGRAALRELDYVRASILLTTAVEKYEEKRPFQNRNRVQDIKHLRNTLAHASRNYPEINAILKARKLLEPELLAQFDWVEEQMKKANTVEKLPNNP